MEELLQDVHHAVLLKDLLPKVGRGVAVRVGRVTLAAVLPGPVGTLIEGQEVDILGQSIWPLVIRGAFPQFSFLQSWK